ncbi:MAG TPA: VWA domain-containing protein [Bryobacteraceae bacterium]|nr:VWA domain-containing protein [Bryobacteraceae bacterium]
MKKGGVFLASVLAGFASAQTPAPNSAEIESRDAQTTFSTRVNLVMVPVVVRDKQGRAVGTLQKEDFQLADKGKLQLITRFAVEKSSDRLAVKPIRSEGAAEDPTAAPVVIANRFTAYLFDDLHIEFGDLVRSRDAARRHLDSLQDSERAAIFTTSGRTMLEFTDDREALHRALSQIQPRPRIASSECPPMTFYMADLIQNRNDPTALSAAADDTMACANMDPSMRPMAVQMAQGAAARAVAEGNQDTQVALSVLKDVVRRMGATPGQRSIVLVSPGFLLTIDYRQEETDILDRAIRNNLTISSLDARGLYVTGDDLSQRNSSGSAASAIAKRMYQTLGASADADILAELAYGTGGTFFQNNNDFDDGFRRIAALPEFVYILGFAPQNLKYDGAFHALKVSLKIKNGLTLDARRGYYAPKHALDSAEQAKQEISEALFSREETHDIPVDLQTQFFKLAADEARLAVVAKVDLKHLRFRKEEGRNRNTLTVVSGVFDRNGKLVSAQEKTVEMRLKEETLEARLAAGLAIKTSFDVIPGSYVIRVVVRDSEGQLMTARNGVVQIP